LPDVSAAVAIARSVDAAATAVIQLKIGNQAAGCLAILGEHRGHRAASIVSKVFVKALRLSPGRGRTRLQILEATNGAAAQARA